jgi:hypothetical protein
MEPKNIQCGDKVRCKISGYEGIVVCVTVWNNACVRIGVQAQALHDGKPVEAQYFDEGSVDVVQRNVVPPAALVSVRPYAAEPVAPTTGSAANERRPGGPAREGRGFAR